MSVERWCRLRGNILFHFKSRDQWSEPVKWIKRSPSVRCCLDKKCSSVSWWLKHCSGVQTVIAKLWEHICNVFAMVSWASSYSTLLFLPRKHRLETMIWMFKAGQSFPTISIFYENINNINNQPIFCQNFAKMFIHWLGEGELCFKKNSEEYPSSGLKEQFSNNRRVNQSLIDFLCGWV